ncbi:Multidrug resistance protein ABC transporter family [Dorcoceras hygrometricum]|uniref:Multidrug resistance protein ABC transporter family n=1 Tax=Dorcoceras hygrometricum TaxID=472368 RepID=A0A2Z7DCY4_9LAMI|nr:Multidrug resistance protein ABC transporter family [Dorcoceras hygrometricum]
MNRAMYTGSIDVHPLLMEGRCGRYSACVRPLQCPRAASTVAPTCVTLNGSGIQLAVGPQPLWLRNHNFGLAQRIMVKRLATSRHDPLGITDSACKNQLVVVSAQYGPFNIYIPIRSTIIGKSRVARDPIAMHTSWRSNSNIASVIRVSMTFRVVRTNQYNQDLGLIHSTNDNQLESPNEGSSIDHQELSVISRGSWGDVSRRFTMIRWIVDRSYDEATVIGMNRMFIWTWARPRPIGPSTSRPPLHFHLTAAARRLAPPPAVVRFLRGWTCSDHVDVEVPFVTNSSALLVQTDEGGVIPVMDSDLVIYRTTLVQTFQVVTFCRVDKSEVNLVTHAMLLFDLRDVCMVIGSLATLDLPMIVDMIGIYVMKGPYCTLIMTNWFLQALSVIPRGSWGDVARRFTMIRWASPKT